MFSLIRKLFSSLSAFQTDELGNLYQLTDLALFQDQDNSSFLLSQENVKWILLRFTTAPFSSTSLTGFTWIVHQLEHEYFKPSQRL